jgi:hypothetical protein
MTCARPMSLTAPKIQRKLSGCDRQCDKRRPAVRPLRDSLAELCDDAVPESRGVPIALLCVSVSPLEARTGVSCDSRIR